MSLREALRLRAREPSYEAGDPCEDCGNALVLCVQCGEDVRCPNCVPYERPSAGDEALRATVRLVRDRPEAGLLAGALACSPPAMLGWVGMTFVAPGLLRTGGALAGAVACGAFLAMGATAGGLPLAGEAPTCRINRTTAPYDRWSWTGAGAVAVQIVLVSLGVAAA
ncbi:hypothetical protein ACFZAM_02340 [Streptomyces sp. NPDC008079]|uniref:hypothetical protein n=1 Tax=Streptomyces sp. NPDC008079 TaxID=3364806 RepID=UPI0036EE548A